jgi:hypothetical protein
MAYKGISPNIGNYTKLDDISSSFDGIETTFSLTSGGKPFYTSNPFTLLLSLGGIIQEPVTSFTIDRDQITFAAAPTVGSQYYCLVLGNTFHTGGLKSFPVYTRDSTRYTIPITATTLPVIGRNGSIPVTINPA